MNGPLRETKDDMYCHILPSFHCSLFLSVLEITDSGDPDICLCCCLSIRLSELLSVNVGLFDQYFRVVGQCIHTCIVSICIDHTSLTIEPLRDAGITLLSLSSWILSLQVVQPTTSCVVSAGTVTGRASFFRS